MAATQSRASFPRMVESMLDTINRWYLLAILHSTAQIESEPENLELSPAWSDYIQAQYKLFPRAYWWSKRCGCMAADAIKVATNDRAKYRAEFKRLVLAEIKQLPRQHRVKAVQIACIWF